ALFDSFFFKNPTTTEIYTLSLHDALPISNNLGVGFPGAMENRKRPLKDYQPPPPRDQDGGCDYGDQCRLHFHFLGQQCDWTLVRSEEHTSELQSRGHLVCRLLLEKKTS